MVARFYRSAVVEVPQPLQFHLELHLLIMYLVPLCSDVEELGLLVIGWLPLALLEVEALNGHGSLVGSYRSLGALVLLFACAVQASARWATPLRKRKPIRALNEYGSAGIRRKPLSSSKNDEAVVDH